MKEKRVKGILTVLLVVLMALCVQGCSKAQDDPIAGGDVQAAGSDGRNQTEVTEETQETQVDTADEPDDAETPAQDEVIDLLDFNGGMTYVELTNLIEEPDKCNGRILKVRGDFATTTENDILYYGCINLDTTQCCMQVVEFEPKDKYSYPDDFPEEGEKIAISGRVTVVDEGNYKYIVLSDADIL